MYGRTAPLLCVALLALLPGPAASNDIPSDSQTRPKVGLALRSSVSW